MNTVVFAVNQLGATELHLYLHAASDPQRPFDRVRKAD